MWRCGGLTTFIGALVALMVIPALAAAEVEPEEVSFIRLGDLSGGRAVSSAMGVAVVQIDRDEEFAVGLDDGDVDPLEEADHGALIVGDSSSSDTGSNGQEAFAWTEDGGMVGLGSLPGGSFRSIALAISRDGKAIVGSSSSSTTGANAAEAFLLDEEGMRKLGDLPGGQYRSEAFDVSLGGNFAVGASSSRFSGVNSSEAFRWSDGDATDSETDSMLALGSLSGGQFRSAALGISDDGRVVVGWSSSQRSDGPGEAFVWSEEVGMLGIGSLEGGQFSSDARDVSSDGSVVIGASSSRLSGSDASEAFVWGEEIGMVGLGFLPGGFSDSEANAVSGDGEVVVGRSRVASLNAAFVWDEENGMRSISDLLEDHGIDLSGWQLQSATDVVRVAGVTVIVGTGLNPSQLEEAWMATVPEPGAATAQAAALLSLAALAARGHRRRLRV